ncbi:UNVERIFIED_CONTAM: hypothetical protein GTU68_019986, partial [Idotea baltica]|nr:hypothetical protein [Idotea baltica]
SITEQFGSRVKQLRERCGLTQEELAEASQLDRTYISSVERGHRNVSLRAIESIANALNVSLRDLFDNLGK